MTRGRIAALLVLAALLVAMVMWNRRGGGPGRPEAVDEGAAVADPPGPSALPPGRPGVAAAPRPVLPDIPPLPPGARPQSSVEDFERLRNERPDEAVELHSALASVFAEVDLIGCAPSASAGVKDQVTLQFVVSASSTAAEATFSDARFVKVERGAPISDAAARCIERAFGTRRFRAPADAPLLPYDGEISYTFTFAGVP